MAQGKFRLYYEDKTGLEVPVEGVRYRILQLPERRSVKAGVTGSDGSTLFVETQRQITDLISGNYGSQAARPVPLLPERELSFELEIQDLETKQYVAPDCHPDQGSRTLRLPASIAYSVHEMKLRLQPYFRVRFQMQQDNTPIPNAPYIAYTRDRQGREVVAQGDNGRNIRGNTDRSGETERILHNGPLVFKFDFPGLDAPYTTRMLQPLVKGMRPAYYYLGAKSIQDQTAPNEGRTSEVAGKVSVPAVLNAEHEELLLLTQDVWDEFEAASGLIENTMAGIHRAHLNLNNALEAKSMEEIRRAEEALGIAEDRVAELLNGEFGTLADLQEVVTFESFDRGRERTERSRMGMRRRYIPQKKYEELKRRRVRGVPIEVDLGVKARAKGANGSQVQSRASHDPTGKSDFDAAKFMQSLKRITAEARVFQVGGGARTWDLLEVGGNEFSDSVRKSESYEVDKAAQWLRFAAGAGASGAVSWSEKGVTAQVRGNAQAKLVLFEGKWVHSFAIPSVKGWQMHYGGMDLGAIVFVLACELYGFVGAKGAITGAVGVTTERGKASVKPQVRDRDDSLAENFDGAHGLPRADLGDPPGSNGQPSSRIVPAALNERPPDNINGMSVKAELFAGAEGGLRPSGELRWLPPDRRDPVSFATLSLDVAVNAGAAASGQLYIYYANGKFRIKASARLCWGVGAKGGVDFVVDVAKMIEFVKWLHYQLLHAGIKHLAYMATAAFDAFSQILFMVIAEDSQIGEMLKPTVRAVADALNALQKRLATAEARARLVSSINKQSEWLIYATPETRGMLLYAITRHYPETHTHDLPTVKREGWDLQAHMLPSHKQAILNVMAGVNARAEWANVMEHMSIDGRKRNDPGKAEGDVLRFLNYGYSLNSNLDRVFDNINAHPDWTPSDVGNTYLTEYLAHRRKLTEEFPRGYEVALYGTPEYERLLELDGQESPTFAAIAPQEMWLDRNGPGTMLA